MSLFTFSDIHGDMYLLLTLLRDVAKVICLNGQDIFDEYTNVSVDDVINSNDFLCNYKNQPCAIHMSQNNLKLLSVASLERTIEEYKKSVFETEKIIDFLLS